MKALIISTSEADSRWIKNILVENEVSQIKSCTNTTDAIELLADGDFTVVLSEIYLPVLNGFDLKKLMGSFGFNIPVVFFSEKVNAATIKEAKYAGVNFVCQLDELDENLPALIETISVKSI